jgi:hypothetical protein
MISNNVSAFSRSFPTVRMTKPDTMCTIVHINFRY